MTNPEPIQWPALSDRDKVRHVLTSVMDCQVYDTWSDFHGREDKSAYPVAFWYAQRPGWLVFPADGEDGKPFDPLHDMNDAWAIVEKMTACMGFGNLGFKWEGPIFKPEHRYLTSEGYPLGTTCWFVYLEVDGAREWVCAERAEEAICIAALKASGVEVNT